MPVVSRRLPRASASGSLAPQHVRDLERARRTRRATRRVHALLVQVQQHRLAVGALDGEARAVWHPLGRMTSQARPETCQNPRDSRSRRRAPCATRCSCSGTQARAPWPCRRYPARSRSPRARRAPGRRPHLVHQRRAAPHVEQPHALWAHRTCGPRGQQVHAQRLTSSGSRPPAWTASVWNTVAGLARLERSARSPRAAGWCRPRCWRT